MKKLTTILLAITLTMGGYAAPQRIAKQLSADNAKHKIEQTSAQFQSTKQAVADFALRQNAKQTLAHKPFNQTAQTNDQYNISFNDLVPDIRYTPAFYSNYGFWYLIFDDGTDEGSFITLAIYSDGSDLSGTYTEDDCYPNYTGANLFIGEDIINSIFNTVQISFTPTPEGIQITGAFTIGDDINITLSYFEKKLMPKDTIDLTIPNAKLDEQSISWQIEGTTEDHKYLASVLAMGNKVTGSYAAEDLNMWGTFVATTIDGDTTIIEFLEDYAAVEASIKGNNYAIDMAMIGTDTILYNVNFTAPLPMAKDSITIAASNLNIDASLVEFMGVAFIAASNSQYTLSIMLNETKQPNGTYTTDDFLSSFLAIGEQSIGFVQGSIDINAAENTVVGELLGDDMIRYFLDLKFEIPTAKDTVKVNFPELKSLRFDTNSEDFYIYYSNDDYGVQVDFYGEPTSPVGIYRMLDDEAVDGYYTFVEQFIDGDTIQIPTVDATIIVEATDNDSIFAVQACILGEDTIAYLFHFNCLYVYTEPQPGTLEYDTDDSDLNKIYTTEDIVAFYAEDYETDDIIYFEAIAYDDLRYISLEFNVGDIVISNDTMPAAGTYTINNTGIANTVTASEGVDSKQAITGSFSGILTSDLSGISAVGLYFLVDGTVTVSYDEQQHVTLIVDAYNSYNRSVHIEYTNAPTTDVNNINADGHNVRKTVQNGQFIIIRNNQKYNAIGATIR